MQLCAFVLWCRPTSQHYTRIAVLCFFSCPAEKYFYSTLSVFLNLILHLLVTVRPFCILFIHYIRTFSLNMSKIPLTKFSLKCNTCAASVSKPLSITLVLPSADKCTNWIMKQSVAAAVLLQLMNSHTFNLSTGLMFLGSSFPLN